MKHFFLFVLTALFAVFCSCSSSYSDDNNQNKAELPIYTKVVKRVAVNLSGENIFVFFTDGSTRCFQEYPDVLLVAVENDTISYREKQGNIAEFCTIRLNGGNFYSQEDTTIVYEKVVRRRTGLLVGNRIPIGIVRYEDNSYSVFMKNTSFIQFAEAGDTLLYRNLNLKTREADVKLLKFRIVAD